MFILTQDQSINEYNRLFKNINQTFVQIKKDMQATTNIFLIFYQNVPLKTLVRQDSFELV